ncbi:MAG: PIN domain-containing protein [Candidatus Diapherotrites archaeon]
MTEYVFDTYALFEILNGNPSYTPYADCIPVVNPFILAEYCRGLLKRTDEKTAYELAQEYERCSAPIDIRLIFDACIMHKNYSKQNLSIPDCIGYLQAKKLGIKFLTGDKEFENMENVEFVK